MPGLNAAAHIGLSVHPPQRASVPTKVLVVLGRFHAPPAALLNHGGSQIGGNSIEAKRKILDMDLGWWCGVGGRGSRNHLKGSSQMIDFCLLSRGKGYVKMSSCRPLYFALLQDNITS